MKPTAYGPVPDDGRINPRTQTMTREFECALIDLIEQAEAMNHAIDSYAIDTDRARTALRNAGHPMADEPSDAAVRAAMTITGLVPGNKDRFKTTRGMKTLIGVASIIEQAMEGGGK